MGHSGRILALFVIVLLGAGGVYLYFRGADREPDRETQAKHTPIHSVAPVTAADTRIDYSRDILPILSHNCFICHGPDEQKAGLRLDQRELATRAARSGNIAIQPGKAA